MRARSFCPRRHLVDAIESGLSPHSASIGRPAPALLVTAALAWACCPAPAALATTYVVDTANDTTTPGKTTLRQAVFEANGSANNIVQFDASLNGSTITLSQGEIAITQPMYLIGPGAGKLTISGNDATRLFNISAPTNTPIVVKLSGMTLTHGKCSGICKAGAVYAKNVSLTVQDAVLDYNASAYGGAIYSYDGANVYAVSELIGTTIAKNSASGSSAGFSFTGGSALHVADSIIDANTAAKGAGGGYVHDIPYVTIARSRITGNKAQLISGGGLRLYDAYVRIDDSVISGNTSDANGGGLALFDGTATLTGDTIAGNSATSNGGGIFADDTHVSVLTYLTVQQSTVSGNSATTYGGGIDVRRVSTFTVNRSLISGNSVADPAGGGGGIAIGYAKSRSYLNNSTVYNNYAYTNGGGVGIFNAADQTTFNGATIAQNYTFGSTSNGILGAGSTALLNSIVAYNFSRYHSQDLDGSGSIFESYSLVRAVGGASITTITGNRNGEDPLLGPLAVNGGPTLTMMPASSPSKSPALDTGELIPPPSGTDQRGLPRSANGRRDMGAVERQYPEDVVFRNGFDSS